MTRNKSLVLLAVGLVMTTVTGLGVVAAFTDSAETGTLQATSVGLSTSIDLQIDNTGTISSSGTNCATRANYVDDQTVVPLSWSNASRGANTFTRYVCLKNVGVEIAQMSVAITGTTNTETGCTGDEIDFDPTSCGTGAGDLGPNLRSTITKVGSSDTSSVTCNEGDVNGANATFTTISNQSAKPVNNAFAASKIATGEYACYRIEVEYPSNVSDTLNQKAQSDRVEWEFRFSGEVA